jgi:hypothetical protein
VTATTVQPSAFSAARVRSNPASASPLPGMPVEAQIQLGHRSLFRYLAQPLLDSFARAFRVQ